MSHEKIKNFLHISEGTKGKRATATVVRVTESLISNQTQKKNYGLLHLEILTS